MIDKMDSDKVYDELITVEMAYGETYLGLHHKMNTEQAIQKASGPDAEACLALSPDQAIQLAKDLIDAAYYAKITRKKRPHPNGRRKKNRR